ncbi:helix-turn-helix domain-containing protein [Streptomyces sp. NPDC002809]|uniref:helix-turn-helix domain-containing protein n=1 Tax=Streptomyces sp. NPDC002809 TaxID=3154433 RepID=UPI00332C99CE
MRARVLPGPRTAGRRPGAPRPRTESPPTDRAPRPRTESPPRWGHGHPIRRRKIPPRAPPPVRLCRRSTARVPGRSPPRPFRRRLTAVAGEAPTACLTWWRTTAAGRLLRGDDASPRPVAQRTGCASEFSFAQAFKQEYGMAPGQYRRQAG